MPISYSRTFHLDLVVGDSGNQNCAGNMEKGGFKVERDIEVYSLVTSTSVLVLTSTSAVPQHQTLLSAKAWRLWTFLA
jgi:hypothetical protein